MVEGMLRNGAFISQPGLVGFVVVNLQTTVSRLS